MGKGFILFFKPKKVFECWYVFDTLLDTRITIQFFAESLNCFGFELSFENHFRKSKQKMKKRKGRKNSQRCLSGPASPLGVFPLSSFLTRPRLTHSLTPWSHCHVDIVVNHAP